MPTQGCCASRWLQFIQEMRFSRSDDTMIQERHIMSEALYEQFRSNITHSLLFHCTCMLKFQPDWNSSSSRSYYINTNSGSYCPPQIIGSRHSHSRSTHSLLGGRHSHCSKSTHSRPSREFYNLQPRSPHGQCRNRETQPSS